MTIIANAVRFFVLGLAALAPGDDPPADAQPVVRAGPVEPDWIAILRGIYGLDMTADLANPVRGRPVSVPGRFIKAGPGPVRYVPEMALGLEVTIRGGYYGAGGDPAVPVLEELWSYRFKSGGADVERGEDLAPPLLPGSNTEFDPGDSQFGLYVANDQFHDLVATEPRVVEATNPRLASQPYKAMIYPYRDPETGRLVPDCYLIGWEYSTNDDFQDVVCRVENARLLPVGDPER